MTFTKKQLENGEDLKILKKEKEWKEIAKEYEKEWKRTLPTIIERREIFLTHDMGVIFYRKIKELKLQQKILSKEKTVAVKNLIGTDEKNKCVYRNSIDRYSILLKEVDKEIKKFDYLRRRSLGKVEVGKEIDIDMVKQVPIGVFLDEPKGGETKKRAFYLCPFHQEKTASFCWYKDTNSYYCFGCGSGGDVIDLIMKLENCDFKRACNLILNIN